jgi:hypothetical protein
VFEDIRQALRELLHGNVPPEGRREALAVMRETLVHARLSLDDLRSALQLTRRRLEAERTELETVRRRKALAEGIGDAETVAVAERFEAQHLERLVVFERKEAVQVSELAIAEREVEDMTTQFKAAAAGVGSGMAAGHVAGSDLPGDEGENLERELGGIGRAQRRAAAEAEAEARLADLKRRMGK